MTHTQTFTHTLSLDPSAVIMVTLPYTFTLLVLDEPSIGQALVKILLNQQSWWSASGQLEFSPAPSDTASQMSALNHDLGAVA